MDGNTMAIVTVAYSFDSDVEALIFNSEEEALKYMRTDYEVEKAETIFNGSIIDSELSYMNDDCCQLAWTNHEGDETSTMTWTLAHVTDKRNK